MPKQKITKEMVVEAAFELAKAEGMDKVMVKTIAEKLQCSVQPIYSYCSNMDSLKRDVIERIESFVKEYIKSHIDKNNLFRSVGKAYIQLAKEEPHIYKMFILHERRGIASMDDLYRSEASPQMAEIIARELKISVQRAKQLHLNMLIYTIGIGTIFSVATPGIPVDEIFSQVETAYEGFLNQSLND